MIITIDKIKQKIEDGKLTIPGIDKHNVHSVQKIKTAEGITIFGLKTGEDKWDNFYKGIQILDGGNSCNVVCIAVDKDNENLTYGVPVMGKINKHYQYIKKKRGLIQ